MNWKIVLCIGSGVFVAHMAIVMIYVRVAIPLPETPIPKRNFRMAEEVVMDRQHGTKVVNREFTISTRLAPPGTYNPPPQQPATE